MKKKNKLFRALGLAVLLTALLPGCRDSLSSSLALREVSHAGRCVGSELSIVPTEDPHRTKSAYAGDPATVTDWCLLQFDAETGLLVSTYYQASGSDIGDIRVVTDHAYDWYAVANMGDIRDRFQAGVTSTAAMQSWLATGIDVRSVSALPMSWSRPGLAFSKADLSAGKRLAINLTRLVARYDIVLDKSALQCYSFTASGVTVEGPADVRAFARSKGSSSAVTTDAATAADIARFNGGDAVTFYAAENRYGEMPIADAASKKPANIGENDHPTFIEITGRATIAGGGGVSVPVTYRFYLGTNATTNFDVIRNTVNTVTLCLTDARIDAAMEERKVIGEGGTPEPLWKIEAGSYSDPRSLAFEHDFLSPLPETCVAESIIASPADLQYRFLLDQVLIDAGVKAYLNRSGTIDVTPHAGTAAVEIPSGTDTLYFRVPYDAPDATGQAHVRTLDGRRSDDLTIRTGRVLDRIEVRPSELYFPDIQETGSYNAYPPVPQKFKLYAYYEGIAEPEDITGSPDAVWSRIRKEGGRYRDRYVYKKGSFQYHGKVGKAASGTNFASNTSDGYKGIYISKTALSATGYETVKNSGANTLPAAVISVTYSFQGRTASTAVSGVLDKNVNLTGLTVTPVTQFTHTGGKTVSYVATASFDDGTTEDVTGRAVWSCGPLLTNDGEGVFTTRETAGTETVTVSFTHRDATLTAAASAVIELRAVGTVRLQVKSGSEWTTADQTVGLGSDQTFRVHVTFDDGGTATFAGGFVLTSSHPSVLIVDGAVTHAAAVGESTVAATYGGVASSNSIRVVVRNHAYTYRFHIEPREKVIASTGTAIYSAFFEIRDHGELVRDEDVSSECNWSVDAALAAVSTQSNAYIVQAGNTSTSDVTGLVHASYVRDGQAYEDASSLTISAAFVPELQVDVERLVWNYDEYGPSGGLPVRVTGNVPWTVTFPEGGADFSATAGSGNGNGIVSLFPAAQNETAGSLNGKVLISNSQYGLTCEVELLQLPFYQHKEYRTIYYGLALEPETATIEANGTQAYTATLSFYSDAARTMCFYTESRLTTNLAFWSSSDESAAVMRDAHGLEQFGGCACHVAHGANTRTGNGFLETTIAVVPVWNETLSATASLRVNDLPTERRYRLAVSVAPDAISSDGTAVVRALLQCSDDGGTSWSAGEDVTAGTAWESSDRSVATVGSDGVVTGCNAASSDKIVRITGTYAGVSPEVRGSVDLHVAGAVVPYLTVTPTALSWPWDAAGVGSGQAISVSAHSSWSLSVPSGFAASPVSGTGDAVVTVYPTAPNESTTAAQTGLLQFSGEGVPTQNVSLLQEQRPAPTLTRLTFDREHYALVRVVDGVVLTSHAFTVTALYSDGSTENVTAQAVYTEQGFVGIDGLSGTMTATAPCSGKIIAASFGGLTAQATCSADDLEIPVLLKGDRFESEDDQNREFQVGRILVTLRRVLSDASRTLDVTGAVSTGTEGPVVFDGFESGLGLKFHFTSSGSGTVTFVYGSNGVFSECILSVSCSDAHRITHSWR